MSDPGAVVQGWGQKQEEKPPGAPSHSSHCIELSTTISMAGPDVNMALQARCVLLAQLVLAAGHNCPTCWLSCSWDIAASSCGDVHTASTEQFCDGLSTAGVDQKQPGTAGQGQFPQCLAAWGITLGTTLTSISRGHSIGRCKPGGAEWHGVTLGMGIAGDSVQAVSLRGDGEG